MLLCSEVRLIAAMLGLVLIAAFGHTALGQTANLQVTAQVDASCTLEGATLAFGTYTPSAPSESAADISYTCTPGTNIVLSLNGGGQGEVTARAMTGTGGTLPYQLYKDSSHQQLWGEGTTDGVTVSDTPGTAQTATVFGQIAAGEQAGAGAYTDTVLITLAIQ